MPSFTKVVAKGYTRIMRIGNKIETVELPDQDFWIADCCGHWQLSGASVRCSCEQSDCPCKTGHMDEDKIERPLTNGPFHIG